MRFIGGKRIMAELKKVVYKESKERLMVGMHRETSFFEAGDIWQEFYKSNTLEHLKQLSDLTCCEDIDENDGIGMMYNFKDMNKFDLIIGDFLQVGTEIPDGLYAKYVPGGIAAHIQIEGSNIAEIIDSAFLLITEAIEINNKEIDYNNFYWCEIYTQQRYSIPLSRGEKVTIDYILPVKPKTNK